MNDDDDKEKMLYIAENLSTLYRTTSSNMYNVNSTQY